ncbi:putative ribonuclease H-like domain-containing protein [Tanacetum coccineum]
MQVELLQFKLQKVWTLVDLPYGKMAIGTKWVYRNKKDDICIVIRNKARLVAQGYTQEEGIDYDKVFALVARIEAIRLFLAYASFKDFVVYQMDAKSAFLYGKIEEEVYVCQPLGFEDPKFPDRVYKVEKALYGLHLAPRAWYETLSTYLLDNRFQRGQIDKTLFIKRVKGDILLVQMSSQWESFHDSSRKTASDSKDDGIFNLSNKDAEAEYVDVHLYRLMIGSLMYLTASRPDIMFVVCQPKLGLWYPKDSPFDLEAYTDSDYASVSLDRKSTTAEYAQMMLETVADDAIQVSTVGPTYYWYALTENPTIYVLFIQQFWNTATARTLDNGEMEITATIDGKVKIVSEASIRRHLKLEDSDRISNLPTTEIFEQLALMGNIATAIICLATNRTFDFSKMISNGMGPVVQGKGSTVLVESHHTPTSAPSTSQPPSSSPSRRTTIQESMVPQPRSPTQTNVANEAASTGVDVRHGGAASNVTSLDARHGSGNIDKTLSMPHDSPLPRVHTLRSDEGRMQHNELMDLVTKFSHFYKML